MKTRLRIKQVIKLLLHSILLLSWSSLIISLTETTDLLSSGILYGFEIFGLIMVGIALIIYHIFLEWLLEHTPLRTKDLKKRVHNIKDSLTIEEKKQNILNGKEEEK